MARFFKLTTEISPIVRKANLTAAQLKIWLYFTEIDHNFSDFISKKRSHPFVETAHNLEYVGRLHTSNLPIETYLNV